MLPILLSASAVFSPAGPSASEDPWIEVRLTITRDPYSSSDQVTLCRVRAVNHGSRRWPGRALAFEARARGGGVTSCASAAASAWSSRRTARSKR